ncbi:two-component system response regulator RppA [Chroococcus sp. FPU101]|uniref:two-component system response regulator RppA n=1 Tax=Chroococcus sp. FPU101 TaxID=1974212 RepID=UPI001A8D0855|nr:two-component system response regulator RppA [Chroococcus sp. FPU101]GFE68975.1 two-component response regulator [Chroococcus sp. FPU101]
MKVLLVEDELDLGVAIQRTLNQEKYIVDWVQDGTAALNYLENQLAQYTLAIFDWMLPGLTGLELCKRLRKQHNSLPILILTARDRWEDRVMGLDAGADDYLVKPFRMEELLARLRSLRRRSPQFQPLQIRVGNLLLDCDNRVVYWQPNYDECRSIRLSKKEFQLLEYLMKHPRQAVTRDQILNYLYEVDTERISNIVAAQVRLLRRRLAELGCDDTIQTVPGGGYRLNLSYADGTI